MAQIIINGISQTNKLSDGKYLTPLNPNIVIGAHFNAFIDSKKRGLRPDGSYARKGITNAGAAILREETFDILRHCNPHDRSDNQETTHLVVGYVQSGKTMSFTGLTALALDNGYRIVVYLAGSKNNLRDQTADRLNEDLVDINGDNRDFYKIYVDPDSSKLDQIVGHLGMDNPKPIILIPILKHYKHIIKLTELFESEDFKDAMENETVLIIDDEADQASLNSYGKKNSQKAEEEEDEKSATYDAILKLRNALPGNTYLQYTATPQANILISMNDLLSPKSHTLLTPGEDYVGGMKYFGDGQSHYGLFNGKLVKEIPPKEVFHKKANNLASMPKSLKDALIFHILSVAIVVYYLHREDVKYLSMMVHPDNENVNNKKFKKWIDNQLKSWRKSIEKEDGHSDKNELYEDFEKIFPMAVQFYKDYEKPIFDDIKQYLSKILHDYNTYLVNSDKDANKKIKWKNYSMHVLVGAEMLNRGFTIENLSTTYMPRYTKGPANSDTIEQRCRFFGYKMDYIEACRVFLPTQSITNYIQYVRLEEELRTIMGKCDNLAQAERMLLLSPVMKATRQNVLPVNIVETKLSGMHEIIYFGNKNKVLSNNNVAKDFISKHSADFNIFFNYNTEARTHRGLKVPVKEAIEFLERFDCGATYKEAIRKAALIRYIDYMSKLDKNPLEFIYFIEMAYNFTEKYRAFDYANLKLAENTRLLMPPADDPKVYPGDKYILGDGKVNDSITIQIHHIILKGAPIAYVQDAYSLAINCPQTMAARYISLEKSNQED